MATKEPIGTTEAAKLLGVLPQTVVRMIRDGDIPGFKVRDVWRVYREDVEEYIRRQMEQAKERPSEQE
jgi:excisionase family DNA binding protein